jgi:hypothetical protein
MDRCLIALTLFSISVPMAFADTHPHWWVLARGSDFKTYDQCVIGDNLSSPTQVCDAGKSWGWSPDVADRGDEFDVTFVSQGLSFRWFRTEAACEAAARANDLGEERPASH